MEAHVENPAPGTQHLLLRQTDTYKVMHDVSNCIETYVNMYVYIVSERERERQTERQTERQGEREREHDPCFI